MSEPDPLAAVTDDGVEYEPGEQAEAEAEKLNPNEWPDLKGAE